MFRRDKVMTNDELATMDDPDFLAERRRVREELERVPAPSADLTARYAALTEEFIRRASAAWAQPN